MPALEGAAEFAGPVFLGASHEHLSAAGATSFKEREESLTALLVQFAHHIINQQDRRHAVDLGEMFGLSDLERDGDGTFLAFTGIIGSGTIV